MSKEEVLMRDVVIEGIAAIQQGKNPKLLKEELCAFANVVFEEEEEKEEKVAMIHSEVAG